MGFWDLIISRESHFERPEKPYLGDIHLCDRSDIGKRISEIADFEVWDGQRWVHGRDMDKPVNIQMGGDQVTTNVTPPIDTTDK